MPFGRRVYGAKRKASDNDEKSEVKKIKMTEIDGSKMANRTRETQDTENMKDWERAADKEMQKKLTVTLPNARLRLPRVRQQVQKPDDTTSAAEQPLEAKPAFKRKEISIQQKAKAEASKDTKAKESKPERKVKRGGKRVEDEAKEERMKEDRVMKDGGEDKTEEDPRKVERGNKEKVTRAKMTRKLRTALDIGEKPMKKKGKAGVKMEDVPSAVPITLPVAENIKKEPDIVPAEPHCQAAPCPASQVMIPEVSLTFGQSKVTAREQTMALDNDNDDNGCLSLHMLSHSMQRGSKDDQLYCLQYANDIMAYLKSLEAKYVIPADFSPPIHPQTNRCMRTTLVDWLIQVQEHQGLLEDSLHLCVAMLDVYLSQCRVTFSQFQLVGLTCLFVASKYEERFPPTIKSLIRLTDDSYLYDEVVAMERLVLKGLNYQLSIPTPLVFLHWFLWRLDCKDSDRELMEMMCIYILSLALLKVTFSKFSASLKSSAVILLSRKLLALHVASNEIDSGDVAAKASMQLQTKAGISLPQPNLCIWDADSIQLTGYRLQDLKLCAVLMVKELKRARAMRFQGPQEKFNQPQYRSVSSHSALSPAALNELATMLDRLPDG